MKWILCLLLIAPAFSFAQNQLIYIKLVDASGKQLAGEVTYKGFEKSLQAQTSSSGGKNNTQLTFTMTISGASADLKRAQTTNAFLQSGQVSVVQPTSAKLETQYTIKMEKMRVVSVTETSGCSGGMVTSVVLQATRIGWTYYQQSKTGAQTVSNKYGFDAETGKEWSNF